jgi:ATP adenylyltransferase
MDYIVEKKKKGCIFCKKPKEGKDKENLILYQGDYAFIIMNKFPYNNGHLMVVPNHHYVDIDQLREEESWELFCLLRTSTRVLEKCFHPHGFNIGMNIGKAGGAGEEHIHFHIVPRWIGDTNFMPILGETKVIPEYLEETYKKLHAAFKALSLRRIDRKGG